MRFLRKFLDKQGEHFSKGGKLEKLFPLYEAIDTFFYTPGKISRNPSHVRDALDLKRMMTMVMYALIPTIIMACYNTGLQANRAISVVGKVPLTTWQQKLISILGIGFDPNNIFADFIHGLLYFLPVYIISLTAGGILEVIFASIRKHEVNEGLFVTSLLFPLILPPTIPYWQVILGITFGVVIAKEAFGGVGMNILNPALAGRAFLFFAYPAQISGDKVWVAMDGISRATPLAELAERGMHLTVTWKDAFLGFIPGSMGETSTLACLIGAFILIVSGIGSWRIMLSVVIGMVGISTLFNLVGSDTNAMFQVTPWQHFVLGGFAFGTVYMATDPVTATFTKNGKYIYGLCIGMLTILIRVINPGFPEGVMLAILFMNVFSPIIDRIYINANIKRRALRNA